MLSVLSVVLACGGHILFRRIVPYKALVAHNDVAGFTIAVIGVIYAVLLAFVVIVVWQQYNDSDTRYGEEVASIADVYAYTRELPPREGVDMRLRIRRYVGLMIDDEWPLMLHGGFSLRASKVIGSVQNELADKRPTDLRGALVQSQMLKSIREARDNRQHRLADNANSLPMVMWVALIAGAAVTVGFGYLFGVENFKAQLAMTGSVAVLIAFSFTILIELDFPFQRDSAIGPGRWQYLQRSFDLPGVGPDPIPGARPSAAAAP